VRALSAFVKWVAARRLEVADEVRRRTEELRRRTGELRVSGFGGGAGHTRSLGNFASLLAGWEVFVRFAAECGAVDRGESQALLLEARAVFEELAAEQASLQAAEEPGRRFLELVGGALASGRAHVAALDGGPPADPSAWGWRHGASSELATARWEPQGDAIGWLDGESGSLLLLPEAAYAAAEKLGASAGGTLGVGPRTLWRRMREKGLVRRCGGDHIVTRVRIQGSLRRVLDLKSARVLPSCAGNREHREHREQEGFGPAEGGGFVPDVPDVPDSGDIGGKS
jgi:hypothetical protein